MSPETEILPEEAIWLAAQQSEDERAWRRAERAAKRQVERDGYSYQQILGLVSRRKRKTPLQRFILAIFSFEPGRAGQTEGRLLTTSELKVAAHLDEKAEQPEPQIWRGSLSVPWENWQVTIAAQLSILTEDQPDQLSVSLAVKDEDGRPAPSTLVDFCDVERVPMQTGVTNDKGEITFTSLQGDRFISQQGPPLKLGFWLGLRCGQWEVTWYLRLGEDVLEKVEGAPSVST